MAVEGPSKADLQCVDNGDGTCGVSYIPTEPGEYKVNVKFADKHIVGSPFTTKVSPAGMWLDSVDDYYKSVLFDTLQTRSTHC